MQNQKLSPAGLLWTGLPVGILLLTAVTLALGCAEIDSRDLTTSDGSLDNNTEDETESGSSTGSDTGVDTVSETQGETWTDNETTTASSSEFQTVSDTGSESFSQSDTASATQETDTTQGSGSDTSDTGTGTGTGSDTGTGTGTGTGSDTGTGTGTGSDTGTGTGTGSDTGTGTGSDTVSDSSPLCNDTDPDYCGPSCLVCTGTATPYCVDGQCVECISEGDCDLGQWCDESTGTCTVCDTAEHCGQGCDVCSGAKPNCTGADGGCVCSVSPTDSCGGTSSFCNASGDCEACGVAACGNGRCDCGESIDTCFGDCQNPCPPGYTHDAVADSCFKFVATPATWAAAQAACSSDGAHLADSLDAVDNQGMSDPVSINTYFWFGLNDRPVTVSGTPACGPGSSTVIDGTIGGVYVGSLESRSATAISPCGAATISYVQTESFKVTPTVAGTWTLNVYPITTMLNPIAWIDTDCADGGCVASPLNNSNCNRDQLTASLSAGTTYYLNINASNGSGTYVLELLPPGGARPWHWDGGEPFSGYAPWFTSEPNYNSASTTSCDAKWQNVRCGVGWKASTGSSATWGIDDCTVNHSYVCEWDLP